MNSNSSEAKAKATHWQRTVLLLVSKLFLVALLGLTTLHPASSQAGGGCESPIGICSTAVEQPVS
ncbi:MAG: hypothetical protein KDE28_19360 [Anaerolineales bacterium]|nr:hypothetical protein [Anaerolineales bacterium]MCB0030084.1 hypothetical protein [Anaerolineales bacterium]